MKTHIHEKLVLRSLCKGILQWVLAVLQTGCRYFIINFPVGHWSENIGHYMRIGIRSWVIAKD